MPGGEFDWDGLGVHSYVPRIEPSDDPEAWTAEDALFVPLRDPKGLLIERIEIQRVSELRGDFGNIPTRINSILLRERAPHCKRSNLN